MPQIKDILSDLNPWWKRPFAAIYKDREVYGQIKKFQSLRQIVALTGLRRVGKTTLLMKAAADAIAAGTDPRRVVYFSFDEFRDVELRAVLHAAEELLESDLAGVPALFLLDEIQKLADWDEQIKALYDISPALKMMISGSESLFMTHRSRATLAGRIFEFRVEPLSFQEYLSFTGQKTEPRALFARELKRAYESYLKIQGFPELVGFENQEIIRKYIKESIVDKVLYRDIPQLRRVKDISVLESLLRILMDEPGRIVDLTALGADLGITRQTLSLYLKYLEDSYLIRKLYNYSKNRRKTERKLKKIYPVIPSPDLFFRDDDMARSRSFECSVVNQLRAEYFWRDPSKNEVDVIRDGAPPLPVEIKSGRIETRGVAAFLKKFKAKDGLIISRDKEFVHEEDGRRIRVVPAHVYFATQPPDAGSKGE